MQQIHPHDEYPTQYNAAAIGSTNRATQNEDSTGDEKPRGTKRKRVTIDITPWRNFGVWSTMELAEMDEPDPEWCRSVGDV